MAHEMFGAVEMVTSPVPFRETGDRTEVKTTPTGFAVGATVAGARVEGACVIGAAVAGPCVTGAAVAGTCVADVAGVAIGATGEAVTDAVTEDVGADVAVGGCAAGTVPSSRVAAVPHPASTNRRTQIATENRVPKSRPLVIQTVGATPTSER